MSIIRSFPDWLHWELANWSRWCWEGQYPHPIPASHCFSFEHHYVAPSDMGEVEKPRIYANAHQAQIVQRVYDSLPIVQRLVLRAEYPQRHESGRYERGMVGAARKLHIRLSEYEAALTAAAARVFDALERGG